MRLHSKLDIYGGKKPWDIPIYSVVDAAHHLQLAPATVRSWTFGRNYSTLSGTMTFHPVICIADQANRLLSFHNLVELHVLSSIRQKHKVKLKTVRRAIEYLQDRSGSLHPLLEREMLTDGKDIFIEQYGQ